MSRRERELREGALSDEELGAEAEEQATNISEEEEVEVEERRAPPAKVVHEVIRRQGIEELERPAASLLWSGLVAGVAIGMSILAEAILKEGIDGIIRSGDLGDLLFSWGHERPMPLVFGALLNPALEDLPVGCGQLFVRLRGRHDLILILLIDAGPQFALLQVAGNDGPDTVAIGQGPFALVEPQLGLALLRILTMAGKAIVGEYGPHVPIEPNTVIRRKGPRQSDK